MTFKVRILTVLAILLLGACASSDDDDEVQKSAQAYLSGHGEYLDEMTGACETGDKHFGEGIGGTLNRADCNFLERTIQNALEYNQTGQAAFWENKKSQHAGSVTPIDTYREPSGRYCRRYEVVLKASDQTERVVLRACRQGARAWRVVQKPA